MANYGTVTSAQQTASSESESASSSNTSAHSTQPGSSLSSSLQSSSSITSFNALTNALRPDPGTEADFIVDDNPFAFSPGLLNKLLAPKSISALLAFGGSEGLQKGLQTDLVAGLSVDETSVPTTVTLEEATGALLTSTRSERPLSNKAFDDRIRVFNTNTLPKRRGAGRWTLIRSSVSWGMLPLLSFACVSFSLAIYNQRRNSEPSEVSTTNVTDHSHHEIPKGPETNATEAEWTNGVAIGVVILLTTIVSIYNKLGAESILCKTHALSDARTTRVVRSGKTLTINSNDLLVGDVMILQAGNVVPADGVFIRGHGIVCDESDTTGESGPLEKIDADAVASTCRRGGSLRNRDPFMVSGAKVLQGVGKVLVTSVGVNSNWGKITMALRSSQEEPSSLEKRLEDIRRNMARLGCAIALLVLLVLIIRYTVDFRAMPRPWLEALSQITDIYITVTTIVFIAVCPGALSFVVPFLRAHSTPRLLKQNALLRAPSVHETVSSVTNILCDRKDLVEKEASVMSGTLDGAAFDTRPVTSAEYQTVSQWVAALSPWATQAFIESAVINSTTYGGEDELNNVHIRDAVEEALLTFVSDHLSLASVSEARQSNEIVEVLPYDSNSQIMATVVKHHARSGYRLLLKGTPGVLLNFCTLKADSSLLTASDLTRTDRTKFKGVVDSDSSQGLSSIGFAYCDIRQWPPASSSTACRTLDLLQRDEIQLNLVFLGILSVQHNLRRNTPETVRRFQLAGISVRLVTGDDIITAKTIAAESFIHVEGGIILDGSTFRSLEDETLMDILPRLQVLAQASPSDRKRLVLKLKELEEVVAVTGDRPEDMEVLRVADVGFSSGIHGSASSKEASSIVLEDCTLPSILRTLLWGRSFDDSVQKVVQVRSQHALGHKICVRRAKANKCMHSIAFLPEHH